MINKLALLVVVLITHLTWSKGQAYEDWEKFRLNGPDLKKIGTLDSRHSRDINSSPWSVGCETLDRNYADFSVYKDYVGILGVKHARLQSGWAKCEKKKGIYSFDWLDSCVFGLVEQGVNPWLSLSYGNPIYASEKGLGANIFTDEETMTAWCNYVKATVNRYKEVVKEWEVWNEPRFSEPHEAYVNLMIRSIEAIKSVQPEAVILGFTVHGFSPGFVTKYPEHVMKLLKEKGKEDIVDYMTYHPYTYNPDDCYEMVNNLEKMAKSFDHDIKLYQGEGGAPSEYRETMALSKYDWTEVSQAKWVLRRMLGDYIRGIRSSVFTIVDLKYPHEINRKGIIHINEDKTIHHPKYAYYGVQNVAGLFDYSFQSEGKIKYQSSTERSLTLAKLTKNGKEAVVLWYDDETPDNQLERDLIDISIEGVELRRPVYVDLLTGNVYKIPSRQVRLKGTGTEFKNLPVWDSPVLLIDQSMIAIKE